MERDISIVKLFVQGSYVIVKCDFYNFIQKKWSEVGIIFKII